MILRSASAGPSSPPVLMIVFNRPAVARQLLGAVRAARPAQLFVAADGPRPDHPEDEALCQETRSLVHDVDWPCELHTLYREANLGLQDAVIRAVDWFFEHVDAGIILEDDCLPALPFFPFAAELLDRYAENARVMHISSLNMRPGESFGTDSYFFAGVGHIWGWASWRRAWRLFDPELADWPRIRMSFGRGATPLRRALGRKFASAKAGRKWSWPRVWYYTTVLHDGLAIIPSVNLLRNIGFGADATHTRSSRHPLRIERFGELDFPLRHPQELIANESYERHLARYHRGSYSRQASDLGHALLDRLDRQRVQSEPRAGHDGVEATSPSRSRRP